MKTALITGASGGIGKALVKSFVKQGYFVSAWYNSDKNGITTLLSELESEGFGGYVFPVQADFSSLDSVKEGIEQTKCNFKHIDVLINNAGVSLYKLSHETSDEEWDKVFSVNTKTPFMLTKFVLPQMISRESGKIINISSVWGVAGASMETVYSASKSALIGFTKALAKEVAPSKITVNCICPGVIDTKMNAQFSKSELEEIQSEIPLGRIGNPEDVSELAVFLASDKAQYITGQIITCDGGYIL